LLSSTSRVVGQAQRFAHDIATGVKRAGSLSAASPSKWRWKACALKLRSSGWRRSFAR
jgi:hypothetical protein